MYVDVNLFNLCIFQNNLTCINALITYIIYQVIVR